MKTRKIAISVLLMGLLGMAQAQVTVSGGLGYDVTRAGGTNTSGLTDTSGVRVSATENLGGGMSATAETSLLVGDVGGSATVKNTGVSLTTKFGTVKAGEYEIGNGITGRGLGGAPVITDGRGATRSVLGGSADLQFIGYTSPQVGNFKFSASSTKALVGTGVQVVTVGATYDVGALSAGVDYNETSGRVRSSASYDLGFAKLGVGHSAQETGVKDSWVVGASTQVAKNVVVGAAYSHGNGVAQEVGATYSLSKRTAVNMAYREVSDSTLVNGDTVRVRLSHAF